MNGMPLLVIFQYQQQTIFALERKYHGYTSGALQTLRQLLNENFINYVPSSKEDALLQALGMCSCVPDLSIAEDDEEITYVNELLKSQTDVGIKETINKYLAAEHTISGLLLFNPKHIDELMDDCRTVFIDLDYRVVYFYVVDSCPYVDTYINEQDTIKELPPKLLADFPQPFQYEELEYVEKVLTMPAFITDEGEVVERIL